MTDRWTLTPFEHLMLADDRDSHPMTFWVRLTVSGPLVIGRLREAVRMAAQRHPLLRARVEGDASGTTDSLTWQVGPESGVPVHFASAGVPLAPPSGRAIDLHKECGIRLYVREGAVAGEAASSVWYLQIHHAVTDAVGAVRFLEDVLAAYGEHEFPRPVDPSLLAGRGAFHLTPAERRRRMGRDLRRIALFFRKFPEALASAHDTDGRPGAAWPPVRERSLDAAALESLKAGARTAGGTLNDLLLRDLFLTLDAWNKSHGGRRRLRLGMPINMRRYADDPVPAANIVSMCFLDRQGGELDDADGLFAGIVRETTEIKEYHLGHAMAYAAERAGKVKGGMRAMMTPRLLWKCAASAVLSNLGEPVRRPIAAGDLRVTRIELMPPIRPFTPLAVGAVTYAGALTLTAHYDPAVLSPGAVDGLLDAFVARLAASSVVVDDSDVGETLLARLVKEHTVKRQGAAAFRSLPIGRNVSQQPVSKIALLPPAEPPLRS